jgi:bla regulator protein blaR1
VINWINYIVESSLVLALLLAFYQLILSKEKCLGYNRYYLLLASPASILIPFINFPFSAFSSTSTMLDPMYEIPAIISQVTTFNEPSSNGIEGFLEFMVFIYVLGIIVVLFSLIKKLFNLLILIKSSKIIRKYTGCKVILTNGSLPSFSFYSYLFLNEVDKSKEEIDAIIMHEVAHISQKHSIDILLIELYKIIFWFNPLSYQLDKAVRLNHEYLADRSVLRSADKRFYIDILLKQIYQNTISSVVHYFGLHSTEQRIKMITSNINWSSIYKPYFSIPFFSFLFFTFSCHFEPVEILPHTLGNEIGQREFQSVLENLRKSIPERRYFFKLTSNIELEEIKAQDYGHYSVDYKAPLKGYNANSYGMIYSFGKFRDLPKEIFSNHIYQLQEVSDIPTPWDGYEKLLTSIDNFANQQVTVNQDKTIWVKFVITTIGTITFTNITGEDYLNMTDEEATQYGAAISAINATRNQWRVGRINNTVVNVEIELPVRLYKD